MCSCPRIRIARLWKSPVASSAIRLTRFSRRPSSMEPADASYGNLRQKDAPFWHLLAYGMVQHPVIHTHSMPLSIIKSCRRSSGEAVSTCFTHIQTSFAADAWQIPRCELLAGWYEWWPAKHKHNTLRQFVGWLHRPILRRGIARIAVLLTPVVFPEVGKQIGQGAYATVAFGLHKESSKKVAIKIYDAWTTWFLVRPYCCQQFKAKGGWLWLWLCMTCRFQLVLWLTSGASFSWCSPAVTGACVFASWLRRSTNYWTRSAGRVCAVRFGRLGRSASAGRWDVRSTNLWYLVMNSPYDLWWS